VSAAGKLSGFPELLPAERAVELAALDHLRRVFQLHGFASIETRAVEPLDVLLRKGEIDKEVYGVSRLHGDPGEASVAGRDALALHFDLTVPFARYVVENANNLEFPFRRYQIQKVWRGERPQRGRYREFTQADIDIVGRGSLAGHFDVEVAQVMAEALAGLPVPAMTLQISNRKILDGFCRGLGIEDVPRVLGVIDKLDKVEPAKVRAMLAELGVVDDAATRLLALAGIATPDSSFVERVRALGVDHDLLRDGLDELAEVIDGVQVPDGVAVTADLRIARGLDYYTGTVFETRMAGYEHLGSVCSGGRYDELARDNRTTYPGVGISLGVTRLLVPLIDDGLVGSRPVPSVVLVAVGDEAARTGANAVAQRLRARGIAAEVAPKADKFGKQIQFAQRRGIPFVWFGAADVKDIRSGEQVAADPDTWDPPAADLTPQIRRMTEESEK
jgi:histidyl-tRNA synthetase